MNLLTMKNIHKAYTDKVLFKGADFSVNSGDKIGVIGINGTGKSTLLKMIAGLDTCDAGLVVRGNNIVVNYLPQSPTFDDNETIYEHVITANSTEENKWSIEGDARAILDQLGFNDTGIPVSTLSGGQKKKVALAAALLSNCDILVLDEPTNHLDNDMTEYLEEYLNNYKGALVMVTHDRYFLDRVTNRIAEIDKGYIYRYETNYEGFLALKAERENIALATQRKHQTILRKELAWIQRGARARGTKQKAHIKRFEVLSAEKPIEMDKSVTLNSITTRLGNKTIELHDISKSFPGMSHPLIEHFSYNFFRTDRIGITGPNGCGKSTLMKLITGILEPDSGYIEVGETVNIGYFSQENEPLDDNKCVLEYVKEKAEFIRTIDGYMPASTLCEEFLFDSTLQYQKIGKLSGGEKRRLNLLRVLMEAPNVLILDEPTAVLTPQETKKLFNILRKMKAQGCAIIIITHKLGEVMDISDRVTILRKGKSIETVNTAESSEKQLTELMVGKAVELSIERPEPENVTPILNVVDLTVKNSEGSIALDDVSFVINRGEILGVAGIAGSGQKELCETIAGLQKIEKGAVLYNKENIIGKTPKEIIGLGISMSFIPEDRLGMGLIASVGMTDNMLLKTYKQGKLCFVDRKPARALSKELIEQLEIKTPSTELPVRMLSGGNVQKVLLGREIHSEPDLLITAYPVRGLDINSSYLIYSLLNEQKKKNTAVLFIGEDLDVLLELCDRIMVLCHGKITGICDAKTVTKEQVGMMMTGKTMEEVLGIG